MFYSSEWNFIKLFILLFHSPKLISRSIHAFSNIQIRLSSYYPFNMMYCIYAYTIYWMKARARMSTRLSERMHPLSPNIRGLAKACEQTRWQMSPQNPCRKLIRDHQTEESVFARTLEMDNGRTDERLSGQRHWRGRVKIKEKVYSES